MTFPPVAHFVHARFLVYFLLAGATAATTLGAIDPGEVVIGELNCVACHSASASVGSRLDSRKAPILGEKGMCITPQWLRAYLVDPQSLKPGTTMPDLLHNLPAEEKARNADALTQYLVSLQSPQDIPAAMDAAVVARGRTLYHTVGCVACHAPQETPPGSADSTHAQIELSDASVTAATLGHPESKTTVSQLTAFLRDPLKIRPSGRMPSMNLSEDEAVAIATYLQRSQGIADTLQQLPGLRYEYYESEFTALPKFERFKAKQKGITAGIDLSPKHRDDNFALRFHGNITIAEEGEYTFYTKSDDGTQLLIDDKPVVDNGGIHGSQERSGRIILKKGDHAILVGYFNNIGGRSLSVAWEGPNIRKGEIPAAVLTHSEIPMVPTGSSAFAPDPVKIEEGRQLFTSVKCAACHALPGAETTAPGAKAFADLNPNRPDSCISAHAAAGLPQYTLSDSARRAAQATLGAQTALSEPATPAQRIEHTMTALNCYACHHRDNRGGPQGLTLEYFTSVGDAEMGDEGRLPPHLDGVGAKLRPEAIEAILWKGAAARPYMATRMPQFGQSNVHDLVPAFQTVDDPNDTHAGAEPVTFPNNAAAGRKLAGVGGVACIACHNFNGHASLGIPAVDMTLMYARLKPTWFRSYLLDPQSLRPGTRMPGFWPDGQALNREILNGDTDKQIEAIWQFLSKGKKADNPDGLIAGKLELLPTKDALIYRNFIQGVGPRCIGVGYPEKADLAFDADEMRISLLWQGAFIDASRHRTGRGSGAEPPLGANVVSWTPGAPLAFLENEDADWPVTTGKAAGYQFRGYRLDTEQRPTFLYTFGALHVEDYPTAVRGDVDASFHRTLTFHADHPPDGHLYFRAAIGFRIETQENNRYLVDGKMLVSLPGVQSVVRQSGKNMELLVPVSLENGDAKIEEELSW